MQWDGGTVGICRPDGANGLFLPEAVWCCRAGLVHVVPAFAIGGARYDAHPGHLEITARVVIAHPFPRIAEPVIARVLRLLRKPCDFIPAPNPETAHARFTRPAAAAIIIELDEKRQVLATPAARRDAAAAAPVNRVGIAEAQLCLLRFVRQLFDAQREGMEIE